jgi:hypothetical protein
MMKNEKLSIHTAAGYRIFAQETNTESFIHTFGRNPRDYAEVKKWMDEITSAASGLKPEKPEPTLGVENGEMYLVTNLWKVGAING